MNFRFWNAKNDDLWIKREHFTVGDVKRILANVDDSSTLWISISDRSLDEHFKERYLVSREWWVGDWRFVPRLIRRMFDWSGERFYNSVNCVVKSAHDGCNGSFHLSSDEFVPRDILGWDNGRIIPPSRQLPAGQGNAKKEGGGSSVWRPMR